MKGQTNEFAVADWRSGESEASGITLECLSLDDKGGGKVESGPKDVERSFEGHPPHTYAPLHNSSSFDRACTPPHTPFNLPDTFITKFDAFLSEWEKTDPAFLNPPPSSPISADSSSSENSGDKRKSPAWAGGDWSPVRPPAKKRRSLTPEGPALPAIVCTPPSPMLEGSASPIAEILEMEVPLPIRAMTRLEFYELHRMPPARPWKGVESCGQWVGYGMKQEGHVRSGSSMPILRRQGPQQEMSASSLGGLSLPKPVLGEPPYPDYSITSYDSPGWNVLKHKSGQAPVSDNEITAADIPSTRRPPISAHAGAAKTSRDPGPHDIYHADPKVVDCHTSSPHSSPSPTATSWLRQHDSHRTSTTHASSKRRRCYTLQAPASHMVLPSFQTLFPFPITLNPTPLRSSLPYTFLPYHSAKPPTLHRQTKGPVIIPATRHSVDQFSDSYHGITADALRPCGPDWLVELREWEFPILSAIFPDRLQVEGDRFWQDYYSKHSGFSIADWWCQAKASVDRRFETLWQLIRSEHQSLRVTPRVPGDPSICHRIDQNPPRITLNPLLRPAARILGYLAVNIRHSQSKTSLKGIQSACYLVMGLCATYQLPRQWYGIDVTKKRIMSAMPRHVILGLLYIETGGGLDYLIDRVHARCSRNPADSADPMVVGYITTNTGFAHFGISKLTDIRIDSTMIVLGPVGTLTPEKIKQYLERFKVRSTDYPKAPPIATRARRDVQEQLGFRIAQLIAFTGIKDETGPAVSGWTGRLSDLRTKPRQAFDLGRRNERLCTVFSTLTIAGQVTCATSMTVRPTQTRPQPRQERASRTSDQYRTPSWMSDPASPSSPTSTNRTTEHSAHLGSNRCPSSQEMPSRISRDRTYHRPLLQQPVRPSASGGLLPIISEIP